MFLSPILMREPYPLDRTWKLKLKPQEIPYDADASCYFFVPSQDKPFVTTRAAIEQFGQSVIVACLDELIAEAQTRDGLDYLQVFESPETEDKLWIIEDGPGGAITALLPDDY